MLPILAFVDIGVHHDGLVHISSLSDKFVEDPHDVVKTGDIVKVKVLEVEVDRRRIALTMRWMNKQTARIVNHEKAAKLKRQALVVSHLPQSATPLLMP